MDKPVEIFEVDDTTRIATYHDYEMYPFEDLCGDDFGVQTLSIARGYKDISSNDEVEQAVSRVKDSIHYHRYDDYTDRRERVLGAWLTAKGYAYEFITLTGYSQGEWAEVVIYTPIENAEYLKYRKEDLRNWFRGDIYNVAVEKLHTYTESETGKTIERWEIEECVGGVISDDSKELEAVGRDLLPPLLIITV